MPKLTRTSKTTAHNNTRKKKNNQQLTVQRPGLTITGTTISFTSPATISDSANGLGALLPDTSIEVAGDTANARKYVVLTSAAGVVTVHPGFITTESAGKEITIAAQDS